jgi:hypothetical protein
MATIASPIDVKMFSNPIPMWSKMASTPLPNPFKIDSTPSPKLVKMPEKALIKEAGLSSKVAIDAEMDEQPQDDINTSASTNIATRPYPHPFVQKLGPNITIMIIL